MFQPWSEYHVMKQCCFSSSFWFELWKFSHHSLNKLIWIWWICSQRGNTFLVSLQSTNESCWIRLWLYASEHFVWRAKQELQLPNSIIKTSATNCSNYSLFLILICIFKETKSWPRLLKTTLAAHKPLKMLSSPSESKSRFSVGQE